MQLPARLEPVIPCYLTSPICELQQIDGFYAQVWLARTVNGSAAVFKCYRQPNNMAREAAALATLSAAGGAVLPRVLGQEQDELGEILVLQRLPGVNACAGLQDPTDIHRFADAVTDILLRWHSHSSPQGHQDLDGTFRSSFGESCRHFVGERLGWLHSPQGIARTTQKMRDAIDHIWAQGEALLAPIANDASSLIHDDCHAANFLVSPQTRQVTAVIDPCHSRFSHREIDLFHLNDARPEFRLLETYLEKHPAKPGFAARRWLFSVFDDVKHVQFSNWFDENWFMGKAESFRQALAKT